MYAPTEDKTIAVTGWMGERLVAADAATARLLSDKSEIKIFNV